MVAADSLVTEQATTMFAAIALLGRLKAMPLKINKQVTKKIPVNVVSFRWFGRLTESSVAAGFKCSACGDKLGARRFGAAMIEENGLQRSLRLCESCGVDAEGDFI